MQINPALAATILIWLSTFATGCGSSADDSGRSDSSVEITDTSLLSVDSSVQDFAAYVARAPVEWQDRIGPIDNHKATLGRILFYDTRLSSNNQVSCASCHVQSAAFGDITAGSAGVNGTTTKNTPQLTNVALHPGNRMFWDERAEHLLDQADDPIENRTEMGESFPAVLLELEDTDFYEALFIDAFGDEPGNNITRERLQAAIAEFEKTLLSFESDFDLNNLDEQQQRGQVIYNQARRQCSVCHGTATTNASFNMVENAGSVAAGGLGRFDQRIDIGLPQDDAETTEFKVGSLRNVAVTAPFTHGGQLESLEEVIAFYNGGRIGPIERATTDPRVLNINLNAEDRADLAAFLHSLTDESFLVNPLFSTPFH